MGEDQHVGSREAGGWGEGNGRVNQIIQPGPSGQERSQQHHQQGASVPTPGTLGWENRHTAHQLSLEACGGPG